VITAAILTKRGAASDHTSGSTPPASVAEEGSHGAVLPEPTAPSASAGDDHDKDDDMDEDGKKDPSSTSTSSLSSLPLLYHEQLDTFGDPTLFRRLVKPSNASASTGAEITSDKRRLPSPPPGPSPSPYPAAYHHQYPQQNPPRVGSTTTSTNTTSNFNANTITGHGSVKLPPHPHLLAKRHFFECSCGSGLRDCISARTWWPAGPNSAHVHAQLGPVAIWHHQRVTGVQSVAEAVLARSVQRTVERCRPTVDARASAGRHSVPMLSPHDPSSPPQYVSCHKAVAVVVQQQRLRGRRS
jgi:hypothetical protein